jgi:hypothetical protein
MAKPWPALKMMSALKDRGAFGRCQRAPAAFRQVAQVDWTDAKAKQVHDG